jgi:hypothetical protein
MSRFPKAVLPLIAAILIVAAPALHAWWVADGVRICTWAFSEENPEICSDGMGGAFVVWESNPGADWNLYARRLNASGSYPWVGDGMDVSWSPGEEHSPAILPDGVGGAFIVWHDNRNGNFDIFMQRVTSMEDSRWAASGAPLCAAAGDQTTPRVISDGAGGMIVVWHDNRVAGANDIYAQRVNAAGVALWTANGVAICTAAGNQNIYPLVSDRAGGAIIAWTDTRSGIADIYVQRVDAAGSVRWAGNGVALCTATGSQLSPALEADGIGGAIVAWTDQRAAYDNVYIQRVNASGAAQWTTNGIPVYSTTKAYQGMAQVVSDGAGGAVIAWGETRDGNGIYAQRLNASGAPLWRSDGVALADGRNAPILLYSCPDDSGGLIATWIEDVAGSYDIFAQRVNVDGTVPWGKTPVTVCAAATDQTMQSIAPDGTGGAIIAWRDSRNGNHDIYAQLIDARGRPGWLGPTIAAVEDVPGDQGGKIYLSWDAARADRSMDEEMSHYSIWRSIDAAQATLAVEGGASRIESLEEFEPARSGAERAAGSEPARRSVIRVEETGALTTYWELMDTQDALCVAGYAKPMATLFDLTPACDNYHYFQVIAHTTDPRVFWISAPDSGRSVDNLAPGAPLGLEGERRVAPFGLNLTWDPNAESDFSCYALYRGLSEDFVPGAENLLGQIDETEYFDGEWNWGGCYYKLSAFDVNGNESEFSLLAPDGVTDTETPRAPAASFLAQNFPNPFNPATRIAFGLAAPADVSLRIYDAAGRLVRVLVEGARPAGNYAELWDGRDARGAAVASGIYFYRLDAGAFESTKKMILLR